MPMSYLKKKIIALFDSEEAWLVISLVVSFRFLAIYSLTSIVFIFFHLYMLYMAK